ncbi:hypothetical protein Bbelb_385880 [Branchiostoma belcheri]|nr:hypothetical protein Bbelb_385880 [Branchiostoma belcheri]
MTAEKCYRPNNTTRHFSSDSELQMSAGSGVGWRLMATGKVYLVSKIMFTVTPSVTTLTWRDSPRGSQINPHREIPRTGVTPCRDAMGKQDVPTCRNVHTLKFLSTSGFHSKAVGVKSPERIVGVHMCVSNRSSKYAGVTVPITVHLPVRVQYQAAASGQQDPGRRKNGVNMSTYSR